MLVSFCTLHTIQQFAKIDSIQSKKDQNGSLRLIALSNKTQSVHSSSTLKDSRLHCGLVPF